MLDNKSARVSSLAGAAGVLLLSLALCGCKSENSTASAQTAAAPAAEPAFALFGPPPVKTGAQIWAENCSRCHNMRPPNEFSGPEWTAIVHHMRLRANLTGDEQRKVTEFLKSSS